MPMGDDLKAWLAHVHSISAPFLGGDLRNKGQEAKRKMAGIR